MRSFLCSRNARPERALVRRPQSKAPHALAWWTIELKKRERNGRAHLRIDQAAPLNRLAASLVGSFIFRWTCAVGDPLTCAQRRRDRLGRQPEADCKKHRITVYTVSCLRGTSRRPLPISRNTASHLKKRPQSLAMPTGLTGTMSPIRTANAGSSDLASRRASGSCLSCTRCEG